jgi:hypothetical protein
MIKTFRAAAAILTTFVLMALCSTQAQAATHSEKAASQPQQGYGDLIFAGVAGLTILGVACAVIVYAARHRDAEY